MRRDGTSLPVEVNAHLFSLQEKPVVLAIARDITERRRNEAEIQEALLRLEYILEFLPDPVFVLDIPEPSPRGIRRWKISPVYPKKRS